MRRRVRCPVCNVEVRAFGSWRHPGKLEARTHNRRGGGSCPGSGTVVEEVDATAGVPCKGPHTLHVVAGCRVCTTCGCQLCRDCDAPMSANGWYRTCRKCSRRSTRRLERARRDMERVEVDDLDLAIIIGAKISRGETHGSASS